MNIIRQIGVNMEKFLKDLRQADWKKILAIFFGCLFVVVVIKYGFFNGSFIKDRTGHKYERAVRNTAGATNLDGEYNEIGKVLVVSYGKLKDKKDLDNLKSDLDRFKNAGFVLVKATDFFGKQIVDVPQGKKPLILTFSGIDKGNVTVAIENGKLISDEAGNPKLEEDCVVSVMDSFYKNNRDFGRQATFFIDENAFEQKGHDLILKYLVNTNREIGNATWNNEKLSRLADVGIKNEVGKVNKTVKKILGDEFTLSTVALPFGESVDGWFMGKLLLQGEYEKEKYKNCAVFLADGGAALAPYNFLFDPLKVARIPATTENINKWVKKSQDNKDDFFVSDGDPNIVTVQKKDQKIFDRFMIIPGFKYRICDGRKVLEEKPVLSKAERREKIKPANKGLYLTFFTASNPEFLAKTIKKCKAAKLDTIVVDIKDIEGIVGTKLGVKLSTKLGIEEAYIKDFKKVVDTIHKNDLICVARIAVFKDRAIAKKRPDLAIHDRNGGLWTEIGDVPHWLDPFSEEVRQYNIDLAVAVAKLGVDEVQYDYIRCPTQGYLSRCLFTHNKLGMPKYKGIEGFLMEAAKALEPYDVSLAIDVFGVVAWQKELDLYSTGQRIEVMARYVDNVCPMLYPSHFGPGFDGFTKPADHPYRFIKVGCEKTQELLADTGVLITPWIQGFEWGVSNYNANYVQQQRKAIFDVGLKGFLIWNAGNVYNTAITAIINNPEPKPKKK